jgi:hypothetical protein
MPQNCSTDLSVVVEYLDTIGEFGSREEQKSVKELFGLGGVKHFDDFME